MEPEAHLRRLVHHRQRLAHRQDRRKRAFLLCRIQPGHDIRTGLPPFHPAAKGRPLSPVPCAGKCHRQLLSYIIQIRSRRMGWRRQWRQQTPFPRPDRILPAIIRYDPDHQWQQLLEKQKRYPADSGRREKVRKDNHQDYSGQRHKQHSEIPENNRTPDQHHQSGL